MNFLIRFIRVKNNLFFVENNLFLKNTYLGEKMLDIAEVYRIL